MFFQFCFLKDQNQYLHLLLSPPTFPPQSQPTLTRTPPHHTVAPPSTQMATSIPILLLPTPTLTLPLLSSQRHSPYPLLSSATPRNISRSCIGGRGGALSSRACSTESFVGRVGLQRREGNVSLLSFGVNNNSSDEEVEVESSRSEGLVSSSSEMLSAMLPFVVALTAAAALTQPSTFTWYWL